MMIKKIDEPFLSICIPTYNKCDRLKKNLSNLLNLEVQDIEIVVCDNASTDRTKDYILSLDDSRVVYHLNEIPIPAYNNWFKALSLAKGKYGILFMDRDTINAEAIPRLIHVLKKNSDIATAYTLGCSEDFKHNAKYLLSLQGDHIQRFESGSKEAIIAVYKTVTHPSGSIFNLEWMNEHKIVDKYLENTQHKILDNVYSQIDLIQYGDLLIIELGTWLSPSSRYMREYRAGSMKNTKMIPHFTPEGRTKLFYDNIEKLNGLDLINEEKAEVFREIYKMGLRAVASAHFVPRRSPAWKHYGVEYKRYTFQEAKKACKTFENEAVMIGRKMFGDGFDLIEKDINCKYITNQLLCKWKISRISFMQPLTNYLIYIRSKLQALK